MTGLPPVSGAPVPPGVEDPARYRAALGFEAMLLDQVAQAVTASGELDGGPHGAAISTALTDSLLGAGGLGLAEDLYRAMALGGGERP